MAPHLRHKTEGEVKVPAFRDRQALDAEGQEAPYEIPREDRGLGQHMLGALLRGCPRAN
jgi:hypothetical protein